MFKAKCPNCGCKNDWGGSFKWFNPLASGPVRNVAAYLKWIVEEGSWCYSYMRLSGYFLSYGSRIGVFLSIVFCQLAFLSFFH